MVARRSSRWLHISYALLQQHLRRRSVWACFDRGAMTVGKETLANEVSPFTDEDRLLIEELRKRVVEELKLVPCYDHDFSIFRWIVGYDRNLDEAEKAMRKALNEFGALKLHKHDFSSIDKIHSYCDSISAPLQYFPGSLIGYDKAGNVISLQPFGGFDVLGLYESLKISDLYLMRIAESEGVMQLLRERENKFNRQLGTTVIIDLEGCSMDMLYTKPLKIMGQMLGKLQDMFPDVLRHLFIINAPYFMHIIWKCISPILSKQTKQKVQILGSDWKECLKEHIDEEVLYKNWGGTKESDTPYGDVRRGGKVPDDLKTGKENDLPESQLTTLSIAARSIGTVDVEVEDEKPGRTLKWWWKGATSDDLIFWVTRQDDKNSKESMVWPPMRLCTEHVAESREVPIPTSGLYKLHFDNTASRFFSKSVNYSVVVEDN
ncbi:hypothetical protein QR680_000159 [Steinernema hermaphroditum]|uniref:CRAL-TRIO domain-containing protein n=1 Tax=Steinernema hermaphroditum TaxID=289476 RepID=A0AA39GTT1_9BILA|nr:hypothetical protein QR680_000159 [Steinernema hermaphroditum]